VRQCTSQKKTVEKESCSKASQKPSKNAAWGAEKKVEKLIKRVIEHDSQDQEKAARPQGKQCTQKNSNLMEKRVPAPGGSPEEETRGAGKIPIEKIRRTNVVGNICARPHTRDPPHKGTWGSRKGGRDQRRQARREIKGGPE